MYIDREHSPGELEPLSTLVVTSSASHGLHEFMRAVRHGSADEESLVTDMKSRDEALYEVMGDFIEGFAMDEEAARLFAAGFVLTYTAISYQAELMDYSLPELQEHIVDGYSIDLLGRGDEQWDYYRDTLNIIKELNPLLNDCWEEYVKDKNYSREEVSAFGLGAVLSHDLMLQHVNAAQLIASVSEN